MNRWDLLSELEPFVDHLFSLRHVSSLSEMNSDQKRNLLLHPEISIHWSVKGARNLKTSKAERDDSSERARNASVESRKSATAKRDQKIVDLRNEMISDEKPSASADIANEADLRLLRTARGMLWTERSINKALRDAKSRSVVIQLFDPTV